MRELLPELARGNSRKHCCSSASASLFRSGRHATQQAVLTSATRRRSAFVVDEYGDVHGLITTQDIVNELVGDLDNESSAVDLGVTKESDRSTSSTRAPTCGN